MSIVTNFHPNPINGGTVSNGLAQGNRAFVRGGAVGTRSVLSRWQRLTVTSVPAGGVFGFTRIVPVTVEEGETIRLTARLSGTVPAGLVAVLYADVQDANDEWLGWSETQFSGTVAEASFPAPPDTAALSWMIYLQPAANSWNGAATIGFSDFIVQVGDGPLDPSAAGHGDVPGWKWNGAPYASSSTGPFEAYTPDGSLSVGGTRLDWLDAIADHEESSASRSSFQTTLNNVGARNYFTIRPAGPTTGTLTLHFTRELATGDPGVRAQAVADSLRSGAPHTITYNTEISGLADFDFVPTGSVTRRLEVQTAHRKRQAVWTVEVEYTEATAA